jgi:hypothetical protein
MKNFNTEYNSSELSLPIVTIQRHVASYPSNETDPVLFINSSKNNVRKIYSVFQKAPSAIQPLANAAAPIGGSGPPLDTFRQAPIFLKGMADPDQSVRRFQYKYQDQVYPADAVEAKMYIDGTMTDQHEMIAHLMTNIEEKNPYINTFSHTNSLHSTFEHGAVLVQNFRSSDDFNYFNGLNMSAAGSSPLILELKFDKQDLSNTGTSVNSFVESTSSVVIGPDGSVSTVSMR